jgi:DNA-binding response OmpR family regulator
VPLARGERAPQILCLAQPSANVSSTLRKIKRTGFDVSMAFTADQVVAECIGNPVAAVVLDAAFIRNDDWSVAKSLKLVRPGLPILLLDRRDVSRRNGLPECIDAAAKADDPKEVAVKLRQLLGKQLRASEEAN